MPFVLLKWVSWNTFLAIIPVAMAYSIKSIYRKSDNRLSMNDKIFVMFLGLVWLAFMPNTAYLLTEWRHFLDRIYYSNTWSSTYLDARSAYDFMRYILFYAFYSGIGAITFCLAVRPIAYLLRKRDSLLVLLGIPFFFLQALGVYLGLVLRFNSWDIISDPHLVWESSIRLLFNPTHLWFVIIFASFLWLLYTAVDIWIDGLWVRIHDFRQAFHPAE